MLLFTSMSQTMAAAIKYISKAIAHPEDLVPGHTYLGRGWPWGTDETATEELCIQFNEPVADPAEFREVGICIAQPPDLRCRVLDKYPIGRVGCCDDIAEDEIEGMEWEERDEPVCAGVSLRSPYTFEQVGCKKGK
jgi:hypothetical protein